MTKAELELRCKNRNFDRIVVVVKDVFRETENMERIQKAVLNDTRLITQETGPALEADGKPLAYSERRATSATIPPRPSRRPGQRWPL